MAAARSGGGCCSGRSTPPPAALTTTTPPTTRRWQPNGGWRSWSPPRGLPLAIAATQRAHREPAPWDKAGCPHARIAIQRALIPRRRRTTGVPGHRSCRAPRKWRPGSCTAASKRRLYSAKRSPWPRRMRTLGSQAEARAGRGPGEHARPRIPLASCRPGSRPMRAARIWAAVVASWARPHTLGVCRARAVARWPV